MSASTTVPASRRISRPRTDAAAGRSRASSGTRRSWGTRPLGSSPWTTGAATLLTVCLIVGAGGLAVAWFGASGSATFRTELIWIAVGVGVCVLAALGEAVWLMVGWRRLGAERLIVAGLVRQRRAARMPDASVGESESRSTDGYVVSAGMRRRHRPGCDVVRGKPIEVLTTAECETRGLLSCGMCDS